MKVSIYNQGTNFNCLAKAFSFVCFLVCFFDVSVADEFRCWKSSLPAHTIAESYIYGHPPTNETEVCTGIKICETTWQQIYPGSRLMIIKQGCLPSGSPNSKYRRSCGNSECLANYVDKSSECPFGPQALCCCTRPLCNSNVVKYNDTCKMPSHIPTQTKNKDSSTESSADPNIVLSDVIIIPLMAGFLLLFCAVTLFINWFCTRRKHRPCNEASNGTIDLQKNERGHPGV